MTDAGTSATTATRGSLLCVVLGSQALLPASALGEADRAQAVRDLLQDSHFVPRGASPPFVLYLSIVEGRLALDVRDVSDRPLVAIGLALGPFRRLMKDYHLLVESYAQAVQEGREARIQAIDVGRRGLHNEGAELLIERLRGKVELDAATARRLFTLVCVLQQRD